jgi:hypothetical protein
MTQGEIAIRRPECLETPAKHLALLFQRPSSERMKRAPLSDARRRGCVHRFDWLGTLRSRQGIQ